MAEWGTGWEPCFLRLAGWPTLSHSHRRGPSGLPIKATPISSWVLSLGNPRRKECSHMGEWRC